MGRPVHPPYRFRTVLVTRQGKCLVPKSFVTRLPVVTRIRPERTTIDDSSLSTAAHCAQTPTGSIGNTGSTGELAPNFLTLWRNAGQSPFSALLREPEPALQRLAGVPVSALSLSQRAENCLRRGRLGTIGDLLAMPVANVRGIRLFGPAVARELAAAVQHLADEGPAQGRTSAPANPGFPRPSLTLRYEWETFSGAGDTPRRLPVASLPLSGAVQSTLKAHSFYQLGDLLAHPIRALEQLLGADAVEEIIEALPPVAAEYGRTHCARVGSHFYSAGDIPRLLRQRWAAAPVEELDLGPEITDELHLQRLTRLGPLLAAYERRDPLIWLNVPLRKNLEARLTELGLTEPAQNRWTGQTVPTLDTVCQSVQNCCRLEDWVYLTRRYPLLARVREAAAAIPDRPHRPLPRVELDIQRKLISRQNGALLGALGAVERTIQWLVQNAGGLQRAEETAAGLVQWIAPGQTSPLGLAVLVLEYSDRFVRPGRDPIYALNTSPHHCYGEVLTEAEKLWNAQGGESNSSVPIADLAASFSAHRHPITPEFARACLHVSGDWQVRDDGTFSRKQ